MPDSYKLSEQAVRKIAAHLKKSEREVKREMRRQLARASQRAGLWAVIDSAEWPDDPEGYKYGWTGIYWSEEHNDGNHYEYGQAEYDWETAYAIEVNRNPFVPTGSLVFLTPSNSGPYYVFDWPLSPEPVFLEETDSVEDNGTYSWAVQGENIYFNVTGGHKAAIYPSTNLTYWDGEQVFQAYLLDSRPIGLGSYTLEVDEDGVAYKQYTVMLAPRIWEATLDEDIYVRDDGGLVSVDVVLHKSNGLGKARVKATSLRPGYYPEGTPCTIAPRNGSDAWYFVSIAGPNLIKGTFAEDYLYTSTSYPSNSAAVDTTELGEIGVNPRNLMFCSGAYDGGRVVYPEGSSCFLTWSQVDSGSNAYWDFVAASATKSAIVTGTLTSEHQLGVMGDLSTWEVSVDTSIDPSGTVDAYATYLGRSDLGSQIDVYYRNGANCILFQTPLFSDWYILQCEFELEYNP